MIKSCEELDKFIENIDAGNSLFQIEIGPRQVNMKPQSKFEAKIALTASDNWLNSSIGSALSRYFCPELKKWVPNSNTLYKVKLDILRQVLQAILECMPNKEASRTSLYKEYRDICDFHSNNTQFIDDMIGILNYYNSAKTDETCKSNVIGLLTILRKKYGAASRNKSGVSQSNNR